MSSDSSHYLRDERPSRDADFSGGSSSSEESEGSGANPLEMLHSLLKGRYHWAILLALVFGATAAFVGYRSVTPKYSSRGLVRILPYLPKILYSSDNTGAMPMYSSFVDAQTRIITSERVVSQAIKDPAWQALRPDKSEDAVLGFMGRILVENARGGETMDITFIDTDDRTPQVAVMALIKAYDKVFKGRDTEQDAERLKVLNQREIEQTAEMRTLTDKLQKIGAVYGTVALDNQVHLRLEAVSKAESDLRTLQAHMAAMTATTTQQAAPGQPVKPLEVPLDVLALTDPRYGQLHDQEKRLQRQLDQSITRFGEGHSETLKLQNDLNAAKQDTFEYLNTLAKAATLPVPPGGVPAQGSGAQQGIGVLALTNDVGRLKSLEANLQKQINDQKQEAGVLGKANMEVNGLNNDIKDVDRKLTETRNRIEELQVESGGQGRIEVLSYGSRVAPEPNKRTSMTALGGMFGAGAGVGVILLWGLLDGRMRTLSDTKSSGKKMRVLGVVPLLSEKPVSSEAVLAAEHAVHMIRARLQAGRSGASRRVLAITSPTSGDGKTSLTAALGMSFAASGQRTLLIDADLVGGGLTTRLAVNARPKLGQMLCRDGAITRDRLNNALKVAQSTGKMLGEVLVGLRLVDIKRVTTTLQEQRRTHVGLLDALSGDPLGECVAETGTKGLYILPVGDADGSHVGQASPAAFHRLLQEARQQFDAVLIDTGPILGSPEAASVAAEADGVVVTLSRGAAKSSVRAAMHDLDALNARVLGIVFNRADTGDIMMSSISSRAFSSTPPSKTKDEEKPQNSTGGYNFGPIARAVISKLPHNDKPRSK